MKARLPLLELLLSALCLWAAWYHTPAGALVRSAGAWLFRTRSTARPLLAYYGAGTWGPPMRLGTWPEIVLIKFE